jgi:carboxypeptidase family protein
MSLSKYSIRALVFALCSVFLAASASAQFRAGIQGTVTDTSGAAVKGAKVTVTSQETGASQDVTTGDTGFYSVAHLAPGLYTVSVALTGFKTNVIKDVEVSAEAVEGVDVVLQPGAVTEQVTVTGDSLPTLDTEDASLSGTITKAQIEDLPQFRGDPFELLRLTPGVFGTGARNAGGDSNNLPGYGGPGGSGRGVFQVENAVQVSANGSRVEANGYQLDGVSTNSQGWGGASVITPNTESVKEIKIEVSPYSAENANGAGAIVEVVTQNGTNNFHGSAVLRTQSPGLNAFQRWGGPNGASPNRDNLLLHSYLGSLGGPIWKNKLFAFFSFEHLKLAGNSYRASSWEETSQFISALPSGSLAAQIFAVPGSGFSNSKILPVTGVDPTHPDGTGGTTCAALGMPVGPSTCQDSSGLNGTQVVQGGVDLGSNMTGAGFVPDSSTSAGNYSVGGGLDGVPDVAFIEYDGKNDNITTTQFNGRVDYNVTQKDSVAFSMFTVPLTKTFLPGGWVDGRQYNTFNTDGKNETAALLWNRTINPNTINEARMNVTRWYFDEIKSNPQAPFGVPVVNIVLPPSGCCNKVGAGFPFGPGVFFQTRYVIRDTLTKVHGTHVLKFGGEFGREQNTNVSTGNARPQYDFNNLWSFANDAPNDEGGVGFFPWTGGTTYNPTTGVPTDFRKYFRMSTYGFFGQDTWKFKPNLTITMGLRYDYFTPLHEKFGNISNLILGQGAAALTGARIQTGGNFTNPDRNNFGPQLGFAWSPRSILGHEWNSRIVLRGGIGVAYNRLAGAQLWNSAANPPSFVNAGVASTCSFTDPNCADRAQIVYGFSSGGINSFAGFPANSAAVISFDPNTGLPAPTSQFFSPPNIAGAVQDLATPYTWHYSMEGEYDLGHNWVAAVSYQGSQSRKYMRAVDYNLLYQRPTGLDTFTGNTVNLLQGVTMFQTDVNAHYSALLARATHRLSHGLLFTGSYRFSKSVDECSGDGQCGFNNYSATRQFYPWDQRVDAGPSDFDVTHSFTANALYELPFFRGRHDWLYTLAGGWKLDTILTLTSGFPWTPVFDGVCQSAGTGIDGLCTLRPSAYLGGAGTDHSTSTFQKTNGNFTGGGLNFFSLPVAGSPTVPGIGRNSFRGPRYTGIDLSFGKRFTLPRMRVFGENAGFEVKANAFNIFNKLNLTPFGYNSDSTRINNGSNSNPKFGQATAALGARVFEFIARFSF